MTSQLPLSLVGENLGTRHRDLNNLVNNTCATRDSFQILRDEPEETSIDRLFKIDVGSSARDVDYILKNLKDDDMLYVSRALRSKWLLDSEHKDIINPSYLEDSLYPEMRSQSVSKMKHWIHLHLRDEHRCQEFYQYYFQKNYDYAIKFLSHCGNEFILQEVPNILLKLTPFYLKLLCEKCPEVAKIYFDRLSNYNELRAEYLKSEKNYYDSLKSVLKSNANIYLDITEKYYNRHQFGRLSSIATKYIMTHHKSRFINKPELYTAWILDVKTLARFLNSEESKDIVMKLARAKYVSEWFSYKNIEPLVKRVIIDERAAFKKKVFVKRDVGNIIEEWPYEHPTPLEEDNSKTDIFEDEKKSPREYELLGDINFRERCLQMRCSALNDCSDCGAFRSCRPKTLLDRLFDEFRFVGFSACLWEVRKRLAAESNATARQSLLLVLVSKSGGRADSLKALLAVLAQHGNEPAHVRATVLRSLVKRAQAWRLPADAWSQLETFGHGLGLDGAAPEAACNELLHAAVLRALLHDTAIDPSLMKAYVQEFSTLREYALDASERATVAAALPRVLLSAARATTPEPARLLLRHVLATLAAYHLRLEDCDGALDLIRALADEDLLRQLFRERIARRQLFRGTFHLIGTDAAYVNALRHDLSVLDISVFVQLVCKGTLLPERFLRKLVVYFGEPNGLASQYLAALKKTAHHKNIARSLAILLGSELDSYLKELDKWDDIGSKNLSVALRANAHVARPQLNLENFGWTKVGAKAIANRVLTCRTAEIESYIKLLLTCKRTVRLAVVLAQRSNCEAAVFAEVATLRPTVALRAALLYYKHRGDAADPRVWPIIRPLLRNLDLSATSKLHLREAIGNVSSIPLSIRAEYSTICFPLFKKISFFKSMPMLCNIELLLPEVDGEFVEKLLLDYLDTEFTVNKNLYDDFENIKCTDLYLCVFAKYLLLCKDEETQQKRFEAVGKPFLKRLERLYEDNKENFVDFLNEILQSLKYTKVFFDPQYNLCLTVMENIVGWMKSFLPIEKYFEKFVIMHLTMLYYKAIRQGLKQAPEVFNDDKRKNSEGVAIVGEIFGRYIARELNHLTVKYFMSVIKLYADHIGKYINEYFNYTLKHKMLAPMIKGILAESKGAECRVAVHMFCNYSYDLEEDVQNEIRKNLMENVTGESAYFLQAELFLTF